jgi:O-antigen/teichoic acid export membrane protein
MKNAKIVFNNTIFLYLKIIISLFFTILSTRILLKSLGAEDFGIFNLIAGIITLLSFLNGAMTVTTQRYLSYHIGSGDIEKIKVIFKSSVILHLLIGISIVILLEVLGLFLFNGILNIPVERIQTAKIVFQCMVLSTFFTINSVPYDSAINSNEDMFFDSITGIIESIVKLLIAIYLLGTSYDKLVVYGVSIASLTIFIRIIKSIWCNLKYRECQISIDLKLDIKLILEMAQYSLWNLFGAIGYVASSEGLNFMLNIFFGPKLNASYGISKQVNSQMQSFSVMMVKAFNPQIVKNEGSGDRQKMLFLAMKSSKFSTFLLLILVIPFILELPFILKIWLELVPDFTYVFCVIILINSLLGQLSTGLKTAVQAVGKIKLYQAVMGSTILLTLPIAFFLLSMGYPSYSVLLGASLMEVISLMLRIKIVNHVSGLPVKFFTINVVLKSVIIFLISFGLTYLIQQFFIEGIFRFLITTVVSTFLTCLMIWFYGLIHDERIIISGLLNSIYLKFSKSVLA